MRDEVGEGRDERHVELDKVRHVICGERRGPDEMRLKLGLQACEMFAALGRNADAFHPPNISTFPRAANKLGI